MKPMTRRRYLMCSALTGSVGSFLVSENSPAAPTEEPIEEFMEKFSVPGLSLAIAKDGQMIRQEALGIADKVKGEPLTMEHRFRIASVSKPITSTAVFLLIERGKLRLDDLVFGKAGLLGIPGPEGITVNHLLTHTSGGWGNKKRDPMFQMLELDHAGLIEWTLKNRPLENKPGEQFSYSNFGYCLLGRVIEKVSGQTYEQFVSTNVLSPVGAGAMAVGSGQPEVSYYKGEKPAGEQLNVPRMDAHGGWIGTPSELVKFALGVDGLEEPVEILKKESLAAMTKRGGVNESYACGWNVNKSGNCFHGGSLPGLTSLLVRTSNGYSWAACANTRSDGIGLALDRLMWKLVRG